MLILEKNNKKIGTYLNQLILAKYEKVRRFCIDYLKCSGMDWEDDSVIAKMQNRMSQIINGNKAIQIYDLPIFCELLGVSCEEILSAGKHFVPISGHVTNYEIAFTKDKAVWDRYINHKDKLILNSDEYNKTVIDYALEFKNYDFLKYLMDNKYIWFVDNSQHDCFDRIFGFSAGTSIKKREISSRDMLDITLRYRSEELGLRQKIIALAMENKDFDVLDSLRAREIPTLYQVCIYWKPQTKCKDYFDERVINEIAESKNGEVFRYFSEDFPIKDKFGEEHWFIYPYIGKLLDVLITKKNKYAEAVLRRTIDHNNRVYNKIKEMVNEAFEVDEKYFNPDDEFRVPVETIVASAMHRYQFDLDDGFLSFVLARAKNDYSKFCANVVYIETKPDDLLLQTLVEEVNRLYEAVRDIQPDTSMYQK